MFRRKSDGLDLACAVRSLDVLVLDEADRLLEMGFEARWGLFDGLHFLFFSPFLMPLVSSAWTPSWATSPSRGALACFQPRRRRSWRSWWGQVSGTRCASPSKRRAWPPPPPKRHRPDSPTTTRWARRTSRTFSWWCDCDAVLAPHSLVVSDLSGRGQVQQPGDVSKATQAREAAGLLQVYFNNTLTFSRIVAFHVYIQDVKLILNQKPVKFIHKRNGTRRRKPYNKNMSFEEIWSSLETGTLLSLYAELFNFTVEISTFNLAILHWTKFLILTLRIKFHLYFWRFDLNLKMST